MISKMQEVRQWERHPLFGITSPPLPLERRKRGGDGRSRDGIDVAYSTDKNKRDYNVDNLAAQDFADVLMDDEWINQMFTDLDAMNGGKSGRPFEFSDRAVTWGMMVRSVFKISFRLTLGLVNNCLRKAGLSEISLTQFFDRAKVIVEKGMCTCDVNDARILAYGHGNVVPSEKQITAAVDSTGFSLNKYGGWLMHRHDKKPITGWVKLHAAVNVDTGEILAFVISDESCGDPSCMERLMDLVYEAGHKVSKIFADAAYDAKGFWNRYNKNGTEFCANIKSPLLGKFAKDKGARSRGCPRRAAHIRFIKENGRDKWKEVMGYGRRWKVECAFSDIKRMFGDMLRSRCRFTVAGELFWKINPEFTTYCMSP